MGLLPRRYHVVNRLADFLIWKTYANYLSTLDSVEQKPIFLHRLKKCVHELCSSRRLLAPTCTEQIPLTFLWIWMDAWMDKLAVVQTISKHNTYRACFMAGTRVEGMHDVECTACGWG